MKVFSLTAVLSALCLAACTPASDVDADPLAGPVGDPNGAAEAADTDPTGDGGDGATVRNGINVNRLRLPDMEKLPSDKELASKEKPDKNSGGVIARPPSE